MGIIQKGGRPHRIAPNGLQFPSFPREYSILFIDKVSGGDRIHKYLSLSFFKKKSCTLLTLETWETLKENILLLVFPG